MVFNAAAYESEAAALLAHGEDGSRLMPLAFDQGTSYGSDPELKQLLSRPSRVLFPNAVEPEAAHAGLWLYFGFFDESHRISQDLHTPEGSYWHGILHRMEPDPSNAAYWFRRVGTHPVFIPLRDAAEQLGYRTGPKWEWQRFINDCEEAGYERGSERVQLLQRVQLAEWQLLFDYCAKVKA